MPNAPAASGSVFLPRALIFIASLWLIGSWVLTIGFVPPVHPSSSSYEPGVRLMLLCLAAGLMIGWPLMRLSQVSPLAPLRQIALDVVVLTSMIQVVLWPLRLVTRWTHERTAAIDATLVGWMLITGAIVAAATCTSNRAIRSLAMAGCLGLGLLGPVLAAGGLNRAQSPTLVEMSPFLAIRSLSDGGGAPLPHVQWTWLAILGVAALLMWCALALHRVMRATRSLPPMRN